MVYERVPCIIKHMHSQETLKLTDDDTSAGFPDPVSIMRHVSTAILMSSRKVHAEANNIIERILKTFIFQQEPRIIFDITAKRVPMCDVFGAIGWMDRAIVLGATLDLNPLLD
jgi:hypothetical protein